MHLKAAAYQGESALESIVANTLTIKQVVQEAAAAGIDVLLFAELFLTGYNIPPHRLKELAISQDGSEMQAIRDIALENKIAIALGYSECVDDTSGREDVIVYNSCICIDGTGQTVLNYRKSHLWDPYLEHERLAFVPGDCLPVGDLTITRSNEVIRIGILICFDCEFPEPARVLALQGAQVLLIPTALAEGPVADSTPTVAVPGRAAENNLFIMYSNLIGASTVVPSTTSIDNSNDDNNIILISDPVKENNTKSHFCGQSGIFGPDGCDLARASKTETGMFAAVLDSTDFEAYITRNNYLQERRPDLYSVMTSSPRRPSSTNNSHSSIISARTGTCTSTCAGRDVAKSVSTSTPPDFIHFNAAGDSPMPACVLHKVKSVLDAEHELGGYAAAEEVCVQEYDHVYELIGELINCSTDQVALVDSATTAWTRAFYSLELQCGDVILTCAVEYASNYVAILQQAKRTHAIVLPIASNEDGTVSVDSLTQLLQEHGEKVKAVSITWIPTNGGVLNDAKAIGSAIAEHGPGALYILDACQAVGQVSVDVESLRCHVLTGTGRKYLRGPRGTGFLFVSAAGLELLREPVTVDLLSAPYTSGSDSGEGTYTVVPTAKRFEQWEKNMAGLLGLGAAIHHLLHTVGSEWAYSRITELAVELRSVLSQDKRVVAWDLGTAKDKHSRCGIVTFSVVDVDSDRVKQILRDHNIFVSITGPTSTPLDACSRKLPRMVRASVHYFNTSDEIYTFCDVIKNIT